MSEASEPLPPDEAPKKDPLRRWVLGLVAAALVIFAYSVIADRLTPFSNQATVQAFLIRMAPELPGRVVEVGVADNQLVETGTLLFRLDPQPYEIAVAQAEARLAQAGQSIGASTAGVETAQSKVAEALAARDNAREQAGRILELVRRNVYPRARGDDAEATLARAEATFQGANSELERARRQLGPEGADNPQIRDALAALEKAQLDLLRTRVYSPGSGVVTNLQLAPGGYVTAGQPALTFIDARAVWISVLMRENSLEYVRPGRRAGLVFDTLPGRIFPARVESVGWGIGGTAPIDSATGLVMPPTATYEARRFPVTLVLTGERPAGNLRYGGQVTVLIYAQPNFIMDAIGTLWLRIYSLLTYLS